MVPKDLAIQNGNDCIVDVMGVHEYGIVGKISETPDAAQSSGNEKKPFILRRATLQDKSREKETALMSKMAMSNCVELAKKHKLPLRIVRIRFSFDKNILKVLFAADERIDFRQLIKDLSDELKVRVEMKQIGIRDESGIIGGLAVCGRSLCCCTWLEKFEAINVKMAKTQNLSLNPGAISGMCGRLKCCLRYENDVYAELGALLPKEGTRVSCPDGSGVVVGQDVLRQRVKVRVGNHRVVSCRSDEARIAQDSSPVDPVKGGEK
jgi:cell fate regulator YaaT (PSP1 superfamily)